MNDDDNPWDRPCKDAIHVTHPNRSRTQDIIRQKLKNNIDSHTSIDGGKLFDSHIRRFNDKRRSSGGLRSSQEQNVSRQAMSVLGCFNANNFVDGKSITTDKSCTADGIPHIISPVPTTQPPRIPRRGSFISRTPDPNMKTLSVSIPMPVNLPLLSTAGEAQVEDPINVPTAQAELTQNEIVSDEQSFTTDRSCTTSDVPCIISPLSTTQPPRISRRGSFLNRALDSISETLSVSFPISTNFSSLSSTERPQGADSMNVPATYAETVQQENVVSQAIPTYEVNPRANSSVLPVATDCTSRVIRQRKLPTANYLRLNLKKKCFSRKGAIRQRTLQRKVKFAKLKRRYTSSNSSRMTTCFTCGETGHWAKKCPVRIMKSSAGTGSNGSLHSEFTSATWRLLESKELDIRYPTVQYQSLSRSVSATTESSPNHSVSELQKMILDFLRMLGFKTFRSGQELVILRIVAGVSTLAVLPTAAGKSLCYQIPAALCQKLYKKTALVISPLISLMEDQILKKITTVNGAYLNSSQSVQIKEEILEAARRGEYAFLMIAPEALVESDWLLQPGRLPPISFACVDEAHCLADWSHHFRPAYLRVCKLLRENLGVKCFLGLSATCTQATISNVCLNLGIQMAQRLSPEGRFDETNLTQPGYVQPHFAPIPTHLCISASMDVDRDEALLALLTRQPFNQLKGGILIYCATRDLTERLASFIRTRLQDVVDRIGRRRVEWTTACYHAGQTTSERSRIQKRFMAGRIRVLVATSAFGMGLNKEDLQAVIHYSLTKSFENYIQEIGRVGRTQQTSFCHAFLPPSLINDPCEANELRRHIFVNHIDRILLKRFLGFLFGGIKCICREGSCNGHVRAVDPIEMSEKLDLKVESLATLLAFLELDPSGPLISSLQPGYAVATIDCYGGPGELAYASERCLAVAAALGLEAEKHGADSVRKARQLSIDLSALCNRWGWHPGKMRQELKGLEWNSSGQRVARTGINVVMSKWSWWLWIHGPQIPVSNDRLDKCLDYLANRLASVEAAGLDSLECLTQVLATVAKDRVDQVYPPHSSDGQASEITIEREKCSRSAHELIESYFMETSSSQIRKNMDKNEFHWPTPVPESLVNAVRKTIREFISIHGPSQGEKLSGRNVANILHGISTPQYPSFVWSRVHRFWRAHLNADWPCIKRLATEELLQRL